MALPLTPEELKEYNNVPTTPTSQKLGDTINALYGSGGGGGVVPSYARYVDLAGSDVDGDGSPGNPFRTIQKALDDIGLPVDAADERNVRAIFVGGGIYDEDIALPAAGVWQLTAMGHVTLGSGDLPNLGSTTTRNVTWENDQSLEFSQMRPTIFFTQGYSGMAASSTQVALGSTGWDISGDFTITSVGGGGGSTTTELYFNGVKIRGLLDASGKFGIINMYLEKSFLDSSSSAINQTSTNINFAKECEFDGLLNVASLGQIERCELGAGATYPSGFNANLPPSGFFACQIAGTLTAPASNYRADGTTQALSPGAVLAGGNTLVDLQ